MLFSDDGKTVVFSYKEIQFFLTLTPADGGPMSLQGGGIWIDPPVGAVMATDGSSAVLASRRTKPTAVQDARQVRLKFNDLARVFDRAKPGDLVAITLRVRSAKVELWEVSEPIDSWGQLQTVGRRRPAASSIPMTRLANPLDFYRVFPRRSIDIYHIGNKSNDFPISTLRLIADFGDLVAPVVSIMCGGRCEPLSIMGIRGSAEIWHLVVSTAKPVLSTELFRLDLVS